MNESIHLIKNPQKEYFNSTFTPHLPHVQATFRPGQRMACLHTTLPLLRLSCSSGVGQAG
nr:hypothetical protein [uncultured Pedobacter sp.]